MSVNGLAIQKPSIGVAPCDMLMEQKTRSLFNRLQEKFEPLVYRREDCYNLL